MMMSSSKSMRQSLQRLRLLRAVHTNHGNSTTYSIYSNSSNNTTKHQFWSSKQQKQKRQFSTSSISTATNDIMDEYFPPSDANTLTNTKNSSEEEEEDMKLLREEEEEAERQAIRDEIDSRTGRLFSDRLEITDNDWSQSLTDDDLPDWTREICSRVSLERVKVHPDGIPTIDELATLPLPPPPPPHPAVGTKKPYLTHRKSNIRNAIELAVESYASPHVERILNIESWEEKQDEIDVLFEKANDAIRNSDKGDEDYMRVVLGSQPYFTEMVESCLEDYLKKTVKDLDNKESEDTKGKDTKDENVTPIFMDLLKLKGQKSDDKLDKDGTPKILYPLMKHERNHTGRMLEEWELAADEETKRIMIRQCFRQTAQALSESSSPGSDGSSSGGCRVYLKGRKGTGKTAALAGIVASARASGHVVLYLPDGDRLRKLGFFHVPNDMRFEKGEKVFDLPFLTKEVCEQLLETHEKELDGMNISWECMTKFNSGDQLVAITKMMEEAGTKKEDEDVEEMSAVQVLKIGIEDSDFAAGCYGAVVHTLMNQTDIPFTVVMDQFNCYFDHGHYFHQEYDPLVKKSIPLNKFTLFEPLMDALGVEKTDNGEIVTKDPVPIKRGGIIVGTTESHAVKTSMTSELTDALTAADGCHVIEVPQYSTLEVDHILANFEVTGIGRLRFDRGETVMNKQEVAYLRMVSGGVGQKLLDECCGWV